MFPKNTSKSCRINICYLGLGRWPNGPGDPRIFQKQLASVARAGISVKALVTGKEKPYDIHNVRIVPKGWQGGLWKRISYLKDVFNQAMQIQADTYWIGNYELLPVAVKLKHITGAKIIYDAMEHWLDMIRQSPFLPKALRPFASIFLDAIERFYISNIDLLMTADFPTMERYIKHKNRFVNFNFPSLRVFDSYNPEFLTFLRDRYKKKRVLAYVGGLSSERGLKEMLYALANIRKSYSNIYLLLIGFFQREKWLKEFKELVNTLKLWENIELVGTVEQQDLGTYLRTAEIGLAFLQDTPKHAKNIATKIFDYMCCGIPVVASDLEPMRQFVGRANAGLLVHSSGHSSLAEGILRLLEHPDLARELGCNGRQAIEKDWNWEKEEVELINRIKALLRN